MRALRLLLLLCLITTPAWGQTWQQMPNTVLNNATLFCENAGSAPPPNCVPKAVGGSLLDAWVDGDYDATTGQFRSPRGGGHADGRGNQVIQFTASTGTWGLLTPASLNAPMPVPTTRIQIYPDGTPSSVHTYGAMAWMPWLNRFYSAGGIYWSAGGESVPAITWWWEPGKPLLQAWTQKTTRPGGYGSYAVADPRTKTVLLRTSTDFWEYDPAKDVTVSPQNPNLAYVSTNPAYTKLFSQSYTGSASSTRALSPNGRKIYSATDRSGGGISISVIDRDNLALRDQILVTAGGPAFKYGPGLFWDAGRLVTIAQFGTTQSMVWTIDPTNCGLAGQPACQWVQVTPVSGPMPPVTHPNGTWRKWYRDGCDYIFIPSQTSNVWKFRPPWVTDTCGTPPPPQQFALTTGVNPAQSATLTATPASPVSVGATVTLSRSEATGWAANGYSGDPICANSFAMPARAVNCVAEQVPVMATLTVQASGSGVCLPSGGGTFQVGTQVSPGCVPAPGSSVPAWTPSTCGSPFTLAADTICTATTADIQPPTIIVNSPTPGQLIKVKKPVSYTVTDNMPGTPTVTVLLDGQPFAGTEIDPTTLTEGAHQLVVQAVDAAGNSNQVAVSFISVNCPVCQVPTAATLTIVKAGTGSGTVAGPSGPVRVGDPITLTPTPDPGSSYVSVSPAICGQSPFAMPAADVTCTFTFNLIPTVQLTITKAGTGSGTVAGKSGTMLVGEAVSLTPTPDAGSTYDGDTPDGCDHPFQMPSTDLTCKFTFTLIPPPPSGPLAGLQARTWKGFSLTVLGQSKHARITYDSSRKVMVVAGGDGTDGSGNSFTGQNVFSLDLATTSTWTRLHGNCPATGWIMPPGADDVTLAYDAKRDQLVVMPAYYGATQTSCPPIYSGTVASVPTPTSLSDPAVSVGAAYSQHMVGRHLKFEGNVTTALKGKTVTIDAYTPPTITFTVIDPATNKPVTTPIPAAPGDRYQISIDEPGKKGWTFGFGTKTWARGSWPDPPAGGTATGWGGDSHTHWGVLDPVTDKIYRATNLCGMQIVPLDGTTGECLAFAFTGAPAGSWDPSNDQQAIDVQGRAIYWIARYKRMLVKWSIDQKKIVAMVPMPAAWVKPFSDFGGGDYETHLAFDSKNRVVFIPNDISYGCGPSTASCAPTSQGTLIDPTNCAVITPDHPANTCSNGSPVPVNRGSYFYNVDTGAWESEAAPIGLKVSGNILGYDSNMNVFVYVGRSPTNQYWVYRYK